MLVLIRIFIDRETEISTACGLKYVFTRPDN